MRVGDEDITGELKDKRGVFDIQGLQKISFNKGRFK